MKSIKKLIFGNDHPMIRSALSSILLFAALFFTDLVFRTIYKGNNSNLVDEWVPQLLTAYWSVILCCISLFLPRIARAIYNVLVCFIFTVFVIIHAFFNSFFGTYMSFSSTIFAGDGASFFDWSYFQVPKKLIFFLGLCIIVSVISALILPKKKYRAVSVIATAIILVLSVVGIVKVKNEAFSDLGGIVWESTEGAADIYDTFTDTHACMHMMGIYHYTFCDVSNATGLKDMISMISSSKTISETEDFLNSRPAHEDNEMTGIFKDKNLILVQLESIDTWQVNEIAMPNLCALKEKSIDFSNYFSPKYLWGATFTTESIVNTGLLIPVNSSKVSYFTRTYYPYSAAHLFANAGYDVNSFHRSGGNTYNRSDSHLNWGYFSYNSGPSLELSDYDLDSSFMEKYDMFVSDEKFMTFFITYSGHGPFNRETKESVLYYDMMKELVPDGSKEEYICALCHAYETDKFVGELLKNLESDGHIDDTVIIFYGDHYNHYVTDSELLAECKGTSDKNLMCRVPFFIYYKDQEPMTVQKAVASYDILPTIANMFGLDTEYKYYLGDDAFSDNGGYVIFTDRSWYDGETYFKVYESEATELSATRAEEISKRLNSSWNIVKTDYFKKNKD